jgi:DNA-binding response OmpR family regulator
MEWAAPSLSVCLPEKKEKGVKTMTKILMVEDDKDIVKTTQYILEKKGYDCITAFDGMEGLHKAKNESPDLIILDLMLPKMNGYKIARLLKFDQKYKKIPIIMLTAKAQESDKKLGFQTGADAYMTKPFEFENLLSLIEKHLKK